MKILIFLLFCFGYAQAHEISFSHLKLELGTKISQISLEMPAKDLARQLSLSPAQLLKPQDLAKLEPQILSLIQKRLSFEVAGQPLEIDSFQLEPVPSRQEIEAKWQVKGLGQTFLAQVLLFPDNNLHKTFLDLYKKDTLEQQLIFDAQKTEMTIEIKQQPIWDVLWTFFLEGIRHIYIGPDHILFIVSLMLLGGSLLQLLKIVSAFTVAHSVTLALATLRIVALPASLVEPIIAASIVFVGVHSLLYKNKTDLRIVFAFGFGLIHGFGFAAVLSELELPQQALAWALLAFNLGVEFGQMCIVLLIAPLLGLLRRHSPQQAVLVVRAASLGVIAMGAYWFIERVTA